MVLPEKYKTNTKQYKAIQSNTKQYPRALSDLCFYRKAS